MPHLTSQSVHKTPTPKTGTKRLWCDRLPGLHLEVRSTGARSWRYRYRELTGRQRTVTLGKASELSLQEARKEARRLAAEVRLGGSPAADRQSQKADAEVTLIRVARQALGPESGLKAATLRKYKSQWNRFLQPTLGHRPVKSISRSDVARVLDQVPGTVQRNRVRALLSRLMSHSQRRGHIESNPVQAVEKARERPREDFLGEKQLRAVWAACDQETEDPLGAAAIQLVLLTGCRKGEALQAQWSEFDLESGVWSKSPAYTKSRKRHTVYLDAAAVRLLQGLRQSAEGQHLFPSPKRSSQPRADLRPVWSRVKKRAGLGAGWRIHDLRHSFASLLAARGVPATAIQQLLGHSSLAVTQRYVHGHEDALRQAVESHGVGNVVQLDEWRKTG